MRIACKLAAAVALVLTVVPASAITPKDQQDCEQMSNPGLKVLACTRILQSANLATALAVSAHHHRGVGLLLQGDFDRAIVEFNEALRTDPKYVRSYNSRG